MLITNTLIIPTPVGDIEYLLALFTSYDRKYGKDAVIMEEWQPRGPNRFVLHYQQEETGEQLKARLVKGRIQEVNANALEESAQLQLDIYALELQIKALSAQL